MVAFATIGGCTTLSKRCWNLKKWGAKTEEVEASTRLRGKLGFRRAEWGDLQGMCQCGIDAAWLLLAKATVSVRERAIWAHIYIAARLAARKDL